MSKIKKILLVVPPGTVFVQPDGTTQSKECILPLGMAYLASQLSKKYDVKMYDMAVEDFERNTFLSKDTILYGATFEDYKKTVKDFNPDLVGIQCMLSSRSASSLELCRITKEISKDIVTVLGGHHAGAMLDHVLRDSTDFVVLGEADYSFPELINTINSINSINSDKDVSDVDGIVYRRNGKIITQPQTKFVKDLDNLPYPDWDTIGIQKYWNGYLPHGIPLKKNRYAIMNTSRGCPHICKYCAVPRHTGERNYRARSLESVIKEIHWLIDKYGVEEIQFEDDNFFINQSRLKKLCNLLILNFPQMHFAVPTGTDIFSLDFELIDLLKQANFHNLQLGIETGDWDIQKSFVDKRIDLNNIKEKVKYIIDAGLEPRGFFLIGFPDESREQLQRTLDLATSLELSKIYLIMLTPIPGSQLYDMCVKNDLLYDDFNIEKLRYTNTFIKNKNISREELEGLRVSVWRNYMKGRIE